MARSRPRGQLKPHVAKLECSSSPLSDPNIGCHLLLLLLSALPSATSRITEIRRPRSNSIQFLAPTASPRPCASPEPCRAVQFHWKWPGAIVFFISEPSTAETTSPWPARSGEPLVLPFVALCSSLRCSRDRLFLFTSTAQGTSEHHRFP
jgi:hypothetical protein